jgi:hypothetical protein
MPLVALAGRRIDGVVRVGAVSPACDRSGGRATGSRRTRPTGVSSDVSSAGIGFGGYLAGIWTQLRADHVRCPVAT